jgi:isoleucyl-tRNA synthetase
MESTPSAESTTQPDLVAIEHEMLARWSRERTFERSLEQTAGGPLWTFYEGPPTANGMPGVHHIEARVFKDLFPRFKTMQGYHVQRKAGWDCHGLPVEVAVEKELGLSGKPDIEAYGVAEFNARCRESVLRHVDAFAALTHRMGYWIDLSQAYRTMDPAYVESVWWALKTIFDKGLLVRDYRISPYCPRCGTPLSDHEMGQEDVYSDVTDPSVTVRLRLTRIPESTGLPDKTRRYLADSDLLVWTTTPWTLVANTAVAVHPDVTYVVARKSGDGDRVVVAESLYARVLGPGWHVLADFKGRELIGAEYHGAFGIVDVPDSHRVISGEFVTTADGTGLVHIAPAFGADDMAAARAAGLPVVNPIGRDGRFDASLPLIGGMFFKDADKPLIADLEARGLLFASRPHQHSYPHCWRCGTVLLYYALPSWYIRTTAIKDELLAENELVNWQPAAVKHGRYGEWLRNNVDWALSRTRYWGTPLPLWECDDEHLTCVGSLAELSRLADRDLSGLDPHRPFVDSVTFDCPSCGGPATRVPEVIDVWFDSGSMPFAQWGAPLRGVSSFDDAYPAQFICEAIDQTRGWFYSLMAVGTLVFGRSAYENVVCLGLVLDASGRKMSKHLGNVIEPLGLLDRHGADAVRWFFAVSGSPWAARRVSASVLGEITRKILHTWWNTASFLMLHARASGWSASGASAALAPPPGERPLIDRWLLSVAHSCAREVTASLEAFDAPAAGRRLAALIDDLSNWYVRRSRRRFWAGPSSPDGAAAFTTLHTVLVMLSQLMAPVTPFLSDYLWDALRPSGTPASVHLSSWPAFDEGLIDPALAEQMNLARKLVELGRSARASAGMRTRQPLPRALVSAAGFAALPPELRDLVAEELNVHEVAALEPEPEPGVPGTPPVPSAPSAPPQVMKYEVKPQFRALGKRFGASTQAVAGAIRGADPAAFARLSQSDAAPVTVDVPSLGPVAVGPDDVIVTRTPLSGWEVAAADGATVALDLAVTPALHAEGLAREAVRLIQDARKHAGLDVSDRIAVRWAASDPELAGALVTHHDLISREVLAVSFEPDGNLAAAPSEPGSWHSRDDEGLGLRFRFAARAPQA